MKKFNELLKEYIDTQGVAIYQISKQADINRTFIQNIIAGRKKFPQKKLGDLLNSVFFTSEQIKNLCDAYFVEKYDEKKPEFFDFCNYCFSKKFKEDMGKKYEAGVIEANSDVMFLDSKEKILAAINTAVLKNNDEIFISNFSFDKKEINSIIYDACKNKKFKEFYHYTEYTDDEIKNANIIFNSINYARYDCITYTGNYNNFNLMFPEFVMCGNIIVMFDENVKSGSVIKNKELAEHIAKQNEKKMQNAKTDVVVLHNAFEYMNYLDVISHKKINPEIITLDNHICSVGVAKEIIEDIATEQIKSATQVYQQLISHFDLLLDSSTANIKKWIISYNGLIDFVNTGKLFDFPSGLANNLKPKHRADVLNYYMKQDHQIYLTNPEYEAFDELSYNIELCQNQLLISQSQDDKEAEPDLGIQIVFETEDAKLIESFNNYLEYLTISEKTYSPDYSKKFIQSQIDILNAE